VISGRLPIASLISVAHAQTVEIRSAVSCVTGRPAADSAPAPTGRYQ
jgi:hypothetical protein